MNTEDIGHRHANFLRLEIIIAHIIVLYALFSYPLYNFLISVPFYFLMGGVGISITYHRHIAHNMFAFPNWMRAFGMLWGTLSGQGSTIGWTLTHKKHHTHTDRVGDPHSPNIFSLLRIYFYEAVSYRPDNKYLVKLSRDKMVRWFTTYYWHIHFLYASFLLLFGFKWLIFCYFVPMVMSWMVTTICSVYICHKWGTRRYDISNNSRNHIIVGLINCGEGYHNNHHAYPNREVFSHGPLEFDYMGLFFHKLFPKNPR